MTDMDNFNMEGMTPEDQKRMTQMLEMAQVRDG